MDQGKRDNNLSENELPIWEREPYKGWAVLSYEQSKPKKVRCTLCDKVMQAVRATLDGHAGTKQHKRCKELREKAQQQPATSSQIAEISHTPSLESRKRSRLLTQETTTAHLDSLDIPESVSLKFFELKLLLCSVIHTSTLHGDHTAEILSVLPDARCQLSSFVGAHGKNCVKVMQVIAENIRDELSIDIGNQPYSIIINEYQWDYDLRYWCLCIKYFSEKNESIVTDFLGLIGVSDKIPHDKLGGLIIDYLKDFKLDFRNLIGLGADQELTAKYNLLYESLKRKKPTLLLIPFLPHSLNICFSRAVEKLPLHDWRNVWTSIYNHFAKDSTSSFRYSDLFGNVRSQVKENFKYGFSVFGASWFHGVHIIKVIVNRWDLLRDYFNEFGNRQTCSLGIIFNDDRVLLYFIIISRILQQVHRLYLWSTEYVSTERIYLYLYKLLLYLMRIFILPERMENLDHMTNENLEKIKEILANEEFQVIPHNLNYGSIFTKAKEEKLRSKVLTSDTISGIETQGRAFIGELCRQIIQRFPRYFQFYESLQNFSQKKALKERGRKNFRALPQELLDENIKSTVKSQWENLVTIPWPDNFSSHLPEAFWIHVREHENTYGECNFRQIADFALKAFSLPFGNRNVEYIFSLTKSIQTHIREKIPFEVLDAIIRIRYHFFVEKLDCMSFKPTLKLRKKLETNTCDGSCDPNGIIFELINSTTSGLRMKLRK